MDTAEDALPKVAGDLHQLGTRWALVGGLAVNARAAPRPTADVDVAVAVPDDATAAARIGEMLALGYQLRETITHDQTGRLATARLSCPSADDVPVDLFFASSGVEVEIVAAAEPLAVLPDLSVPVSRRGHLIGVKHCWRKSEKRDRDLRVLIERADHDDLGEARELIAMTTERGYHRGRDLDGALTAWLRDGGPTVNGPAAAPPPP